MNIERDFFKKIADSMKYENPFNRGEELPFCYTSPDTDDTKGEELMWVCIKDDVNNNILGIFRYTSKEGKQEKNVTKYENMEQAIMVKTELVNAGWREGKAPTPSFVMPDGTKRKLNRKERKIMARKVAKELKKNPFAVEVKPEESE